MHEKERKHGSDESIHPGIATGWLAKRSEVNCGEVRATNILPWAHLVVLNSIGQKAAGNARSVMRKEWAFHGTGVR